MKKNKEKGTNGLSPNQEKIMSILEYKKVDIILREELVSLIKKYLKVKDISDLIEKLQKKKKLVSIKKGIYMVIPFHSIDKKWALDWHRISEYLLKENYYIGLYNAFNLHGFTEQIPNKLFVFNTKYSSDRMILHYKFKFFKVKRDKLFGITKNKYPYSDKERTIIDALEYPEYLGGLSEVMDRIKNVKFDKSILIDYAIMYNSVKIMKLVGILTNSSKILSLLNKKGALSYYTTIRKTGTKLLDKKWKIRLI
ncbi:MAG: type IV toxin-antitoxin system AbiEi family antitoxin [Nanoarchaeota archaeon]